jgi:hypothetical protein
LPDTGDPRGNRVSDHGCDPVWAFGISVDTHDMSLDRGCGPADASFSRVVRRWYGRPMLGGRPIGALVAVLIGTVVWPATALASPKTFQCQKPVLTGVEVYGLHNISPARACPPALALFAWENASGAHANALYGCHRPMPESAGFPYLRLHRFRGWKLSLAGRPLRSFTMSRSGSSFHVGGTDFPLNCS